MMFYKFLLIIFLFVPVLTHAGNVETGLSFGPSLVFDEDFNGNNRKSAIHMDLGAGLLFDLDCGRGFFCQGFKIGPSFHYIFPAGYNFSATQMPSTGVVGNFSEKVEYFLAGLVFQKNFFKKQKIQPALNLTLGCSQIKISDIAYNYALANPLNIDVSRSAWQFYAEPSFNIYYAITRKIKTGVGISIFLTIPDGLGSAGIRLPFTIAYNF
ncbi:MAG: hypothetical protein HQM16_18730 [Deltaproteobacteria bacterium]|nr:hypothetical protein [Deltaproteobacteria bacterium]